MHQHMLEEREVMNSNKKIGLLIAFVIVASIIAYILLTNFYAFDNNEENYALITLLIKSLFVMVDISCIVAILNKNL